jgi:hypothetical protein
MSANRTKYLDALELLFCLLVAPESPKPDSLGDCVTPSELD